jgi:hypothetical protein
MQLLAEKFRGEFKILAARAQADADNVFHGGAGKN